MAMWLRDQIADLVGDDRARRYVRAMWVKFTATAALVSMIPVGVIFAFDPDHVALLWTVIALGSTVVICLVGYWITAVGFLREIGRRFGYSTWWCVRHVTLDPAHLIEFINDEVVASGGTTPPSVAEHLDSELDAEDRFRARARAIRRGGAWLQVAALTLNTFTVAQGLRHYGGSGPQLPIQVPGFTADGQNELAVAIDCPSTPRITSSPLSVTADVFTCTSSDGGTVTYSYFAIQDDATAWLRQQTAARRLPAGDALLGDRWAVVTTDRAVLSRVRAIGGVPAT